MMADSNQFHATCLDTYPPVFYMNDTSRRIIGLVHALNGETPAKKGSPAAAAPEVIAAYTFDAGPNAVIFTTRPHAATVLATLLQHFPPAAGEENGFVSSPALAAEAASVSVPTAVRCAAGAETAGAVRHVYVTSAGDGPRVLRADEALADAATGMPFVTAVAHDGAFDVAL